MLHALDMVQGLGSLIENLECRTNDQHTEEGKLGGVVLGIVADRPRILDFQKMPDTELLPGVLVRRYLVYLRG